VIRPIVVTIAVVLGYLGYEAWLTGGGARKLAAEEIAPGRRGHYEVVVRFAPEAFHVTRMQAIGRLIEVKGASVFLMDVEPDDARAIARNYWVEDVRPWKGL
jgi:phosphatidylserine decarboxylase